MRDVWGLRISCIPTIDEVQEIREYVQREHITDADISRAAAEVWNELHSEKNFICICPKVVVKCP